MSSTEELLRLAQPGGKNAAVAIRRLLGLGATVLDKVVTAFAVDPYNSPGLAEVIRRNRSPEAVSVHLGNLESDSLPLARYSMEAVGASGNQAAIQHLVEILTDEDRFETRRALAASALGAHADSDVLAALRETVDRQAARVAEEEEPQSLLIKAVVALAKHGDHSRAPLLLEIASNPDSEAQEEAVQALEVAVTDGMIETLATVSRDPSPIFAVLAAKPLFLLGDLKSYETLQAMAQSDEHDVSQTAMSYLWRLLGTEPRDVDQLNVARREWAPVASAMSRGICYRAGRPVDITQLVETLRHSDDTWLIGQLTDELQNRTGIDVQGAILWEQQQELAHLVNERRFALGALYRWGHLQEIPCG
ncbi:HEAT repeat domain-containing protein [Streptomyces sp. 5K101]|uniref:HEAT repeat domain-containing protein n=1 Tax=Streptomyces sp. 5K101 TaxID=3390037 RepID=UPI00397519D8